ncbi:MAG: ankyrin repeat domain-containing protein [Chlamydiae bacterium]|nr:ankyrin repeat domain-containing protein [Chlamydiota bacterium]
MHPLSATSINRPAYTPSSSKASTDLPVTTIVARAMNYREAVAKPMNSTYGLADISATTTYTAFSTQQIAARTFKGVSPPPNINIKDKYRRTLLHLAFLNKNQLEIDRLLSLGANIHNIDIEGSSCLHYAAYSGDLEVLQKLIDLGAHIEDKNTFGCTALHHAIKGGHLDIVSALVALGCKIESKDHLGMTPLHYAINAKNLKIVDYLLSLGASPNAKSTDGLMPLHLAIEKEDHEIVESLIAKDAHIEAPDPHGYKPLHIALNRGLSYIAEKLLAKGADRRAKTKDGRTPYILAKRLNDQESIALLEEDPYSTAYIALKKLSHVHNLKGIINLHGTTVDLECFQAQFFYAEWDKLLHKTPLEDLGDGERKILKQAFAQAANLKTSSTQLLAQIIAGDLTIIPIASTHHITALIFYKNLLFYCDKSPSDHYPISCFEISPGKITKKIIERIMHPFSDHKETSYYFTSTLPLLLSPIKGRAVDHKSSERCHSAEMSLPLSMQKVGNCAYASTKGALSIALACVCGDYERGQRLYRKLSNAMKRSAYEEVITNPGLTGLPFVPRILKEIKRNTHKHFRDFIIEKGLAFAEAIKETDENDQSKIYTMYSILVKETPFIAGLCKQIENMNPLEMDLFTALIEGFHHQKIGREPWWTATRNLQIKLISLAVKIILRTRRARPTWEAYEFCLREVFPLIKGHPDASTSKAPLVEELENKISSALDKLYAT